MRRRLAELLYGWAIALAGGPGAIPPLCPTCRTLTVRVGTGRSRAERRRAYRHAWKDGGKGK